MMPRCVDRQAGINAFLNAAGWPPADRRTWRPIAPFADMNG